jgi:crossover junction endodeoxyribonuclease RuvC
MGYCCHFEEKESKMIILGIDPGYAIVGWGVIEYSGSRFRTLGYGSIQTPAGMPIIDRLEMIYKGMRELIEKYHPDQMAIEELFFTNNQKTGIVVAEARGIILLAAHLSGIEIGEYTPLQVKQAVVGYGRAEKKQVITMVTGLLGLKEPPKPDDTADALAIAICHCHASGTALRQFLR